MLWRVSSPAILLARLAETMPVLFADWWKLVSYVTGNE